MVNMRLQKGIHIMKKKTKIMTILITVFVLSAVLLIPINIVHRSDGGTTIYNSVTYSVMKLHEIKTMEHTDAATHETTTVYNEGWIIYVFGIKVYEDIHETTVVGHGT